jgi:parallel beta-helix repeat protein
LPAIAFGYHLLVSTTAWAQSNMVLLISPTGEYVGQGQTYYTTNEADITSSWTPATVTISALGFTNTFAAPGQSDLTVGQYSNVVQYPFNGGAPGLNVSGFGQNCTNVCGGFQILELETNAVGQLTHFWATFSQRCDCSMPPLMGELRFDSFLAPNGPLPRTLQVPNDFPTIQAALDDASSLVVDTVIVAPGLYREAVDFKGKAARLISETGPSQTLIMARGAWAVSFNSGETAAASLIGFTLTNSDTGVAVGDSSPTILSNLIVNCSLGIGEGGAPTIRGNEITGCGTGIFLLNNQSSIIEYNIIQSNATAGITLFGGNPVIRNNIIRANSVDGVTMVNGSEPSIVQNLIFDNGSTGIAADVPFNSRGPFIVNNTLERNGGSGGAGIILDGFYEGSRIMNNIVSGERTLNLSGYAGSGLPVVWFNDFFPSNSLSYAGRITNLAGIQGNISEDPRIACQPTEDFHLLAGSACIDAGANWTVQLSTDFDGNPRIVPGTPGGPALVDMGAFEFDPLHPVSQCVFLYCPSNMLVMASAGQNSAMVNYPAPFATPGATVTTSPASGSLFPEGDDPVAVSSVYGTNILNCSFTISVFTTTNLGRALSMTNAPWVSSGDVPWFVQQAVVHPGPVAPQSGAITNNQTSTLGTTLTGPGTLMFSWKVSSEFGRELLSVAVNGTNQAMISGAVDWQPRTLYLGSGTQAVQWTYAKDANRGAGPDAAWLDQVQWTPGAVAPLITSQPPSISPIPGMNGVFSVTAAGTPPFSYQWFFNGNILARGTSSSLVVPTVQSSNAGAYSVVVSNQAGTILSSNANLTLTLSQVLAWGANSYGQTNVPPGLTNVAGIAGGWHHSVALRNDGTVVGWGNNDYGQTNVPSGLSNIVAIASRSGDHSMALRADGTVVVWGDNSNGQTNVPAGLSNVVAISAGGYRCLALKSNGTAVAWGDSTTFPAAATNLVAVSAGDYANLFLRSDGNVLATGTTVPANITNIIAIAAGGLHNLALKADGTVTGWGNNAYGQIGIPAGLDQVVAIAAGDYHSTALRADGTVVAWGKYYTEWGFVVPVVPAGLTNVHAIAAGSDHDLALLAPSPAPFITSQPSDQTAVTGAEATFNVVATPLESHLSYQWRFNETNDIPGATAPTLTLANVQSASAGLYSVRVTNLFGSILSSNATLKVDHPPLADASATRSPVIAPNGSNATVVLDGSRSSDPDNDPLKYLWLSTNSSQSSTLLASGMVAVVVLPLGTHLITLVVSDGLVNSTNGVSVEVLTTTQAVERLNSMVNQSALDRPRPLSATLAAVLASLDRADSLAAASQLQAFQNQVIAQVAPSDPALAKTLITSAQQIENALQGSELGRHAVNIEALMHQPDRKVQLWLSAQPGQTLIVEASTNLVNWETIGVAYDQPEGMFEDVGAAIFPYRFYRAWLP